MGYPKSLPQGCSKLRCRIDRKYVGRPGVGQHEDAQVQKDELNPCRYPSEADLEKVKNCVLKAFRRTGKCEAKVLGKMDRATQPLDWTLINGIGVALVAGEKTPC